MTTATVTPATSTAATSNTATRRTPKLHNAVCWRSGANFSSTVKTGRIVKIVKPGQNPMELVSRKMANECTIRFDGIPRNHRSYIVRVSRGAGRKDYLYFPRVNVLEVLD